MIAAHLGIGDTYVTNAAVNCSTKETYIVINFIIGSISTINVKIIDCIILTIETATIPTAGANYVFDYLVTQ